MAFISIKNAVVGEPLGEKGFAVHDRFTKRDGSVEDTKYFVMFTDKVSVAPAKGAVVNVSGGYSDKIDEYQGEIKLDNAGKPNITRWVRAYKVEPVTDDAPF